MVVATLRFMRFAKGHGTGNDFVILVDEDGSAGLSAGLAAALCNRHTGIGADGVLRAVRTQALARVGEVPGIAETAHAPEWFMDYRNADGSIAEMCGNGIRVFARYLARRGLVRGNEIAFGTRAGFRTVKFGADGDVTVDMGAVSLLGPGRAVIGGTLHHGLRLSVGNPHLACLVQDRLDSFDLTSPPALDPAEFPDGANVELVRVTGPGSASMRVYERGSGETCSCGTGAVAAVAAVAHEAGLAEGSWRLTVPGGDLTVTLRATTAYLTGPAVIVAEGDLEPAWLQAAQAADASAAAD